MWVVWEALVGWQMIPHLYNAPGRMGTPWVEVDSPIYRRFNQGRLRSAISPTLLRVQLEVWKASTIWSASHGPFGRTIGLSC